MRASHVQARCGALEMADAVDAALAAALVEWVRRRRTRVLRPDAVSSERAAWQAAERERAWCDDQNEGCLVCGGGCRRPVFWALACARWSLLAAARALVAAHTDRTRTRAPPPHT